MVFSFFRLIGSTLATIVISQGGNVTMFMHSVSLQMGERMCKILPGA